ncbi:MAG: BglG family transcription antiterminator [Microbacterium gubbeenense]|uniref:BglG family transcription antiterminator n=1 Tax=Microbacterium gubbeenense TaxID=159896 RepID=UPI003F9CD0C8
MTRKRQARMLGILLRRSDWVTAGYIADHLGVTSRSVRSYVTAINRLAPHGDAIESGPLGYRAASGAAEVELDEDRPTRGTPRERALTLVRQLLETDEGVDVFVAALELHVSPGTIEADLRRIRAALDGTELGFRREAAVVSIEGSELARRRFIGLLVHEEADEGGRDVIASHRAAERLGLDAGEFTQTGRDLLDALSGLGYAVNELAAADVVLHVAIACDRSAHGHPLPDSGIAARELAPVAEVIRGIARNRFGAELGESDLAHLASLVMLSIVDSGSSGSGIRADPAVERAVASAVARVADAYDVELAQEGLVGRLALHVENLVRRVQEQLFSRNPMTRSLKAASPLVFEMAVQVASDLSRDLGVTIPDDEITDIAMHLGASLEIDRESRAVVTVALVCPGIDEMRRQLEKGIVAELGGEVEIIERSTRYDPDWAGFGADLVLTTIDPPAHGASEKVVRIPPFLSERDVSRIADAAHRVRRQRRLVRLREEIEKWFVPDAFVRDAPESSPEAIIRTLGDSLIDAGIIDDGYVASALEREALSSTAFTESLAVPHAMTMSANRTAIAVAVSEHGIVWGEDRVHVVALVAFSESDRPAFQTVFEQFVDVFADPSNARRITRRATDLATFLTELAALIDET